MPSPRSLTRSPPNRPTRSAPKKRRLSRRAWKPSPPQPRPPSSRRATARARSDGAAADDDQLCAGRSGIDERRARPPAIPTTPPNPPEPSGTEGTVPSHRGIRWGAAVAIALLVVWWAGRELAPRLLGIVARIHDLGAVAPIAFILVYSVAVVALIPRVAADRCRRRRSSAW